MFDGYFLGVWSFPLQKTGVSIFSLEANIVISEIFDESSVKIYACHILIYDIFCLANWAV